MTDALMCTCNCCGETKPARAAFSSNRRTLTGYTLHCKDCGVWLTLFIEVFGRARDWEAHRIQRRERGAALRAAQKAARDALNAPRKERMKTAPPPMATGRVMCPVLVPIITVWRHV